MPMRPRYPVCRQWLQPRPLMKFALATMSGLIPAARSSAEGGVYGSLHLGQFTRTSRWAMIAITELAMRNG